MSDPTAPCSCSESLALAAEIVGLRDIARVMQRERDAALERVRTLEANLASLRRYRFAMEGIPTDADGNPLELAGREG